MKFSIILPTYNRASTFLKHAINSIVSQSYEDWELIIIDNNSTDNTIDLIKSFQNKKIKVYGIKNHGIIAKSRNLGIAKSTGSHIALIDSDDFWEQDKLLHSSKHFNKYKVKGFCHSEYWMYPSGKREIKHYGPEQNYLYYNLLKKGNCLSLSAVVLHRDILMKVGSFSEEHKFVTAEDYHLWLRLSRINYNINFSNKILGTFRVHDKSESDNILKNTKAISEVITTQYLEHKIIDPTKNKALYKCWLTTGKLYQLKGNYRDSFKSYLKAINYSYLSINAFVLIISLLVPHKLFLTVYKLLGKNK